MTTPITQGDVPFNVTFRCMFCYQLPEQQTCCESNRTCSVRGTPRSMYIANCSALDSVLCISKWHQFTSNSNTEHYLLTSECCKFVTQALMYYCFLCSAPRQFQKLMPCNYTNGSRWSTAFLLR